MDIGILIARLVLGLALAAHGGQKLFGWFGGYGIAGTGGFLEGLGFRPGPLFASLLGLGEVAAGLLTAVGLGGPIGPALMIHLMLVAMFVAHRNNGFFAASNGIELPLLYAVGGLVLASTGPGLYSLDALLGLTPWFGPSVTSIALGLAVVGVLGTLAIRRPVKVAS
jgi:putative oxidoreductase